AHGESAALEEGDEHVGGLDGLMPIPAAAHDERHAGRAGRIGGGSGALLGPRVPCWAGGGWGAGLCQRGPVAGLASPAAGARCTCSASSRDGEGSVPSPIAVTRSAIWWVKVCS